MSKELRKLKAENKPWAKLKVSRRQYEACRPWVKAGMSRALFEGILLELPDQTLEDLKINAQANKLLEGIFGAEALE